MAKNPKEDLFAESTMTFGEHLEELRQCLFRAAIGLVVGVGFGLFYADDVHPSPKGSAAIAAYIADNL